jgi:hypothetical protein
MAKRHYEIVQVSGLKAATIWGDAGWNIQGGDQKQEGVKFLSPRVAIVFRAMQIRANAVASIPFDMVPLKGDSIYDSTDEWKNKCGFLPNPELLFWLIESSWALEGKGYLYQSNNQFGIKKIFKYLAPDSVAYNLEKDLFTRNSKEFKPALDKDGKANTGEGIVSLWMPDPYVEHGPPIMFPGLAALQAMGVLFNMDKAAIEFFIRGMLDAYIVTVPAGTQEADIQKMESTLKDKLQGARNFFRAIFLRGEKITLQNIGGSLQALANVPLTKEKREDVSIALGVPMSKLFSESAAGLGGGGVVEADDKRLILDTALPEWKNIARQLNEQVFIPLGYKLQERHEKMDMFQETLSFKGSTLSTYVTAFNTNPKAALVFAELLGISLTDQQKEALKPEPVPEPLPPVVQPVDEKPIPVEKESVFAPKSLEFNKEMQRYQRKALKHIGEAVSFESDVIPFDILNTIKSSLPDCKSEDDVRTLFSVSPAIAQINEDDEVGRVITMLEMNLKSLETPVVKLLPDQPAPVYNFTMPAITLNAQMPEMGQPSINVNIPEQQAPIVNVTNEVNPTPVTVNNEVSPTPVTVKNTVNMPKPGPEKLTVNYERNSGKILGMTKE